MKLSAKGECHPGQVSDTVRVHKVGIEGAAKPKAKRSERDPGSQGKVTVEENKRSQPIFSNE